MATYDVTPCGNVFNIKTKRNLKPSVDKDGYLRVGLSLNNKVCSKHIHRLVAEKYIPNPDSKPQVNHKNGIKTDNRIDNLEWVTIKENIIHACLNGLRECQRVNCSKQGKIWGSINGLRGSEPLEWYNIISGIKENLRIREMCRAYNLDRRSLQRVMKGIYSHCKGWTYIGGLE